MLNNYPLLIFIRSNVNYNIRYLITKTYQRVSSGEKPGLMGLCQVILGSRKVLAEEAEKETPPSFKAKDLSTDMEKLVIQPQAEAL